MLHHIFLTIPNYWGYCIGLFRGEIVMAYQETYRDVKRTLKSHWYNQILSHESLLESRNTKVKNLEFSRTLIYISCAWSSFFHLFFFLFFVIYFLGKKLYGESQEFCRQRGKKKVVNATLTASGLSECVRFLVSKETAVLRRWESETKI